MREVSFLLSSRRVRKKHEQDLVEIDRGFQASLHGAKYTPQLQGPQEKEVARFSKEQDDIAEKHMRARIEEMKKRANTPGA